MSSKIDMGTWGAPGSEHRHHKVRQVASIVAGVAGAAAALIVAGIVVNGASVESWLLLTLPALVLVWLTGFWWRWDSPDKRVKTNERERRGF